MSRIVWLASYPRSGNTWMRIFLTNIRRGGDQPADINSLVREPIASAREDFDDALGVESSDLTVEEIERYRPHAYRQMAADSVETLFLKIHDAFTLALGGDPIVPADVTLGAIYLVRNPLDVAVSFANYSGTFLDETISLMAQEGCVLAQSRCRLDRQLHQRLLSWSSHIKSWLDKPTFPVHVIRYEDMFRYPQETFTKAAHFSGLPHDEERVCRALKNSSFNVLQDQERIHGFRDRPATSQSFFRQGKAGSWREVLSKAQIARIIQNHGKVMERLGYLSTTGEILC